MATTRPVLPLKRPCIVLDIRDEEMFRRSGIVHGEGKLVQQLPSAMAVKK
ncbi:MAG: hypothetical protein JNM56_05780 [Planctomycetia bacterium]|nr:hypothetical protein [Planctomycetia bacterium]